MQFTQVIDTDRRAVLIHTFNLGLAVGAVALVLLAFGFGGGRLLGQSSSTGAGQGNSGFSIPKFGRPQAQEQQQEQPWKFQGRLHLQQDSTEGYLVLQVDLAPDHYIYSVSPDGSPAPTKISVVPSASVQTAESFSPDQPPAVIENDPIFERRIEKHTDRVQFFVPCRLDPHADYKLTGLPVIEFNGQVCSKNGVCIPIRNQKIAVEFAGYFQQESTGVTSGTSPSRSDISAQAKTLNRRANPTR